MLNLKTKRGPVQWGRRNPNYPSGLRIEWAF